MAIFGKKNGKMFVGDPKEFEEYLAKATPDVAAHVKLLFLWEKIEEEYKKACKKHPKFCDKFVIAYQSDIKQKLTDYRYFNNSTSSTQANFILNEEIYEATEAYLKGDYDHCLQELAQCGAVILRMMEFVQKEKEGK